MLSATQFPGVCAAQSVTCHRKAHPSSRTSCSLSYSHSILPPFRPISHPESVLDDTAVISGNSSFGSAIDSHSKWWSHTHTPNSRIAHTHSHLLELHTSALLLGPPFSNTPASIEGGPLDSQPFFKQITDDYALPFIPSIFAGRCSKTCHIGVRASSFRYKYFVRTSTIRLLTAIPVIGTVERAILPSMVRLQLAQNVSSSSSLYILNMPIMHVSGFDGFVEASIAVCSFQR